MNGGYKNLKNARDAKHQKCVEDYYKNPKTCKNCGNIISYEKRVNDYCNSSCFASKNNIGICRNKKYYENLRKLKLPIKNVIPRVKRTREIKICKLC